MKDLKLKDLKLTPQYNENQNFIGFYVTVIHKGEVFVFDYTHNNLEILTQSIKTFAPIKVKGKNNELVTRFKDELIASINRHYRELLQKEFIIKPLYNNFYEVIAFGETYLYNRLNTGDSYVMSCVDREYPRETKDLISSILIYTIPIPLTHTVLKARELKSNNTNYGEGIGKLEIEYVYEIVEPDYIEVYNSKKILSLGSYRFPVIDYHVDNNTVIPVINCSNSTKLQELAGMLVFR